MSIDIDEIINDCLNNLDLENSVSIDEIYDEAYNSVEEIIGDISLEIIRKLEKKNVEIIY